MQNVNTYIHRMLYGTADIFTPDVGVMVNDPDLKAIPAIVQARMIDQG